MLRCCPTGTLVVSHPPSHFPCTCLVPCAPQHAPRQCPHLLCSSANICCPVSALFPPEYGHTFHVVCTLRPSKFTQTCPPVPTLFPSPKCAHTCPPFFLSSHRRNVLTPVLPSSTLPSPKFQTCPPYLLSPHRRNVATPAHFTHTTARPEIESAVSLHARASAIRFITPSFPLHQPCSSAPSCSFHPSCSPRLFCLESKSPVHLPCTPLGCTVFA